MSDAVLLQVSDHIALVTLNRPERKNSSTLPSSTMTTSAFRVPPLQRPTVAMVSSMTGVRFSASLKAGTIMVRSGGSALSWDMS